MSEVLINAEGVGKKFCRDLKKSLWYGVKDSVAELAGRQAKDELRDGEFWANQDISFELKRGQCLGLLGQNGAGKTTLLKILSGIIKPDSGHIKVRGKVGALIALGAGFNPILTGRENIFVNTSILGMTKRETQQKIEDIIEFAEIEDAIDSPVQSYSSGMKVRLGFAVATTLTPDVLILDEVLAVGDIAFRAKCYSRIGEIMKKSAVILVSHDLNAIGQSCTHGITLHQGKMTLPPLATVSEALLKYEDIVQQKADGAKNSKAFSTAPLCDPILSVIEQNCTYDDFLELHFKCFLEENVESCVLRTTLFNKTDKAVLEWNSLAQNEQVNLKKGENKISLRIGPVLLRNGSYDLTFLLADSTGLKMLYLSHSSVTINVNGPTYGQTEYQAKGTVNVNHLD